MVAAAGAAAEEPQMGKFKFSKLELLEQQRTIDRLRAELGKPDHGGNEIRIFVEEA